VTSTGKFSTKRILFGRFCWGGAAAAAAEEEEEDAEEDGLADVAFCA
jgi:hypothetical protein